MYPSNMSGQTGSVGMNRSMSNPNYSNPYHQSGMNNQYGNFNGPSGMGPSNMGSGGPANMGPNAQSGMSQGAPGPMNNMGPNVPSSGMSSNGPSITQGPHGPSQGPGGPTNMPNAMNNMSPQNVPANSGMAGGGQPAGTPKGAQAAAQAAMMAAASLASTPNRGVFPAQQQQQQHASSNQQQKTPGQFAQGQSQMGFNQNQMGPDNVGGNIGPGSGYNANIPNNLPSQDPMGNQIQGMGANHIPPNAVAPGSGMGMGGQSGMNTGAQMNAMGPPSMPPPSSLPASSGGPMQSSMSMAGPVQGDQSSGARSGMSEFSSQPGGEDKPSATNAGDSSTCVTQSIMLPVTTSTENQSAEQRSVTPSQHSESSNQSQPGEITTNGPSSIVPGGEDSNSQDALPAKIRLQKQVRVRSCQCNGHQMFVCSLTQLSFECPGVCFVRYI